MNENIQMAIIIALGIVISIPMSYVLYKSFKEDYRLLNERKKLKKEITNLEININTLRDINDTLMEKTSEFKDKCIVRAKDNIKVVEDLKSEYENKFDKAERIKERDIKDLQRKFNQEAADHNGTKKSMRNSKEASEVEIKELRKELESEKNKSEALEAKIIRLCKDLNALISTYGDECF